MVFTAMNVGNNHWTILAYMMDLRGGKSVCFFDPLGNPTPRSLTDLFGADTRRFKCFGRVQFDGFQCGVWICWWSAALLDWLTAGRKLHDFTLEGLVFSDATVVEQIRHNCAIVRDARRNFDDLLRKRSAEGTLLFT